MRPVVFSGWGGIFGVEFDGDTYFTILVTVWPKITNMKSTYPNLIGIPINCQSWISNFWKHDIQMPKMEDSHLEKESMASVTVCTACLCVKRVIKYNF